VSPKPLTAVAADTCRGQSAKQGALPTVGVAFSSGGLTGWGLWPSPDLDPGRSRVGRNDTTRAGWEARTEVRKITAGPQASQLPLPRLGCGAFFMRQLVALPLFVRYPRSSSPVRGSRTPMPRFVPLVSLPPARVPDRAWPIPQKQVPCRVRGRSGAVSLRSQLVAGLPQEIPSPLDFALVFHALGVEPVH